MPEGTPISAVEDARLTQKGKELDLRLKELEIQRKEDEQRHRLGTLRSSLARPIAIAAMIAGWASGHSDRADLVFGVDRNAVSRTASAVTSGGG
jgi:hypothetical protein